MQPGDVLVSNFEGWGASALLAGRRIHDDMTTLRPKAWGLLAIPQEPAVKSHTPAPPIHFRSAQGRCFLLALALAVGLFAGAFPPGDNL